MLPNPRINPGRVAGNNANPFLPPLSTPSVNDAPSNYYNSLKDTIASLQVQLFQDLFPVSQIPYPFVGLPPPGAGVDKQTVQNDINNLRLALLAINQIATGSATAPTIPPGLTVGGQTYQTVTLINSAALNVLANMWEAADNLSWPAVYNYYVDLTVNYLQPAYNY